MENGIIETRIGNNTEISTLEGSFLLPESTITAIATMTNDREEAIELLAYLKERVDLYNASIEVKNSDDTKFKFSPKFVENLCVSLLCEGFLTIQIIEVLSGMHDYEIFGTKYIEFDGNDEDRVKYIVSQVKNRLDYSDSYYTTEDSYDDVDEVVNYHGV